MPDHWQSLVASLAIVALFVSAWVQGHFVLAGLARHWRNLIFGAMMGAGAVASMMLAVPVNGVFLDLRLSLIAIAGFFGGPLAVLVTTIIAAAFRALLGGPAELTAIAAIVVMAVAGVGLSRLTRVRVPAVASGGLLALAVAVVSLGWMTIFQLTTTGTLPLLVLAIALMNAVATAILALFIMRNRVQDRERDLFRAAFIESPDLQYVKTPDSRFAAVNTAVARVNGFLSPAEMRGKSDLDLVEPERAKTLMAAEQRIVRTGEPLLEVEELVTDAAGNDTWYLTSKVALHNADGEIIGIAGSTRDITMNKLLRTEVTDSRNQLNYVLSEITDGIAMFDAQGTLVYRNQQYCDLFPLTSGIRRSGQHIRDILEAVAQVSEQKGIPVGGEAAWVDEVAMTLKETGEQEIELFDGRWLHIRTRPTSQGSALVVVSDVTTIKHAEAALLLMTEQLKLLATTDGLTGLTNRRAFDQALESEIARHRRSHLPMALLMIDVDRFKTYNDTYGHPAGDEVLKAVATCLQASIRRPTDIAARYGGEEFMAILPGTDEEGAVFVADTFRECLGDLHLVHRDGSNGLVTASVGVSVFTGAEPEMSATELLGRADKALYRAKDTGRDRVVSWRLDFDVETAREASN